MIRYIRHQTLIVCTHGAVSAWRRHLSRESSVLKGLTRTVHHVCTAVQSYCAAARCPPSLSHRPCIDVSASKRGAMECELLFLLADELTIKAQLAARAVGTFFLPQQAPLEEDPTDWVRNTTTRGVPVLSGTNFRTA